MIVPERLGEVGAASLASYIAFFRRAQSMRDAVPDCMRERRRQGVADLPVRMRLRTGELPIVRESLEPCGHPDRQLRRAHETRRRRVVRKRPAVNTEFRPSPPGPSGTEVGPSVLLGSAHQCRTDAICRCRPGGRTLPSARCHQVDESLTDSRGALLLSLSGPTEILVVGAPQSDEYGARTQLGYAEIGRLQKPPTEHRVTKAFQIAPKLGPVVVELRREQAADVLDHDCVRGDLRRQPHHLRKEVTLVVRAELLACDGEWRAGDSTGEQANSAVVADSVEVPHVG